MRPTSKSPSLLLLGVLLVLLATSASAQRAGCQDQKPDGSVIGLVAADEPGEPLVVIGRAVDGDGQPLAGVKVRVFHTDAEGYYSAGGMDESKSRLCGVLETATDGGYRIETILPGEYATGGPRPHIHFDTELPGGGTRFFTVHWSGIEEGGDPAAGERGASTRPIVRDGESLHLVYDLVFR
ncbi:MAG: hypothetical protein MPN21_02375 [Thermoanaerobaculia bacterium]|nr:hypothetical protein [Thermoanaerobaculia bacterium]